MSIIRNVTKVFMSIILCGFIGALVAGVASVCVYLLFAEFPTNDNEGWAELFLIMMGLGGSFVGFVLGGIYGAIRTLMNRKREEKGNGKS